MKWKKAISLFLVLAMSLTLLAGCSGSGSKESKKALKELGIEVSDLPKKFQQPIDSVGGWTSPN